MLPSPSAAAVNLSGVSFEVGAVDELLEADESAAASLGIATELGSPGGSGLGGLAIAVGDAVALAGSVAAAFAIGAAKLGSADRPALAFAAGFVLLGVLVFAARGCYRVYHASTSSWNDIRTAVPAVALNAWLLVGALSLFGVSGGRPAAGDGTIALVVLLSAVAVPAGRVVTRAAQRRTLPLRRVVVVGSGMMARRVARSLSWDPTVKLLGLVDDDPAHSDSVLGGTSDLPGLCEQLHVDQIVVAFSRTHPAEALERLRSLRSSVSVAVVPRYFELLSPRSSLREVAGIPLIELAAPQLGPAARAAKRLFDLVVTALLLTFLAPVMGVIAFLVKKTSEGPVLFRQERVGYRGRRFVIYKFRTMTSLSQEVPAALRGESEVDGPLFKMRDDPRITPLGRFLRRTSLDELPQLLNVLKGEMSLVGPRPFIPSESAQMRGHALRRFEVRPGLTGLWQISGRSMLSYEEVVRLDYLYVASWSFWWDLKIILSTPAKVLRGLGAF